MTRLVLLSAVSGAGKSYGLRQLARDCATVIELDQMIEQLYVELAVVGPVENGVYDYDNWRPFLESHINDSAVITAFTDCFTGLRGRSTDVVIAGNHFEMASMTAMIDRSIARYFDEVLRLLLDVPADIVFEQRQKRRTRWDLAVTLEQVAEGIERMRLSATEQGFVIVSPESMMHEIERFLRCEKRGTTIISTSAVGHADSRIHVGSPRRRRNNANG